MKILVLKTDCLLDQDTKENLREEARKAAQRGIMILDGGTSLEVIEIDKSALLGVLMIKEEAKNLEPRTFEEPPLLQITLKDLNSIPEVIHKGESLKGLINVGFNWETSGPDEFGSAYINLQNADVVSKYPNEKRTQYKRGKALNELPNKDDLVWDKERGVYILQKGNMK